MKYHDYQIVLQEVPNEVSLCFTITGCKIACKGCHSTHLWNDNNGTLLTDEIYHEILDKYSGMISCVLFMGGEWCKYRLIELLKIAKSRNLKTCLYSGEDGISTEIMDELTFMKLGKWTEELGGLDSITTNQQFIEVESGKLLNHLFQR